MKNKKLNLFIMSILLSLVIILIAVGTTYAFFQYTKTGDTLNTVTAGILKLTYSEASNSISLNNAAPITDENGMALNDTNSGVFDFSITASTSGANIEYDIVLMQEDKELTTAFQEEHIKVFLTSVDASNNETKLNTTYVEETKYVKKISELTDSATGGTILYSSKFTTGATDVSHKYRLRIWIANDANQVVNGSWTHNGKTFKAKVNIETTGN